MRSSGVTLEEIRRLFKILEESKSNNSIQILIDNEMCKQFQDIIETICSSKDKKDKEIERLNNIINELEKYIRNYIDLLVNNPDMIEQGQLDILYEVLDKLKELKEGK